MGHDHVLDLVGIDVESRDKHHVLLAVGDLDVALLVHETHVAGAEPAIRREHLGRLVGAVPVALGHLRAANADLADLAQRHFGAGFVEQGHVGGRNRQADVAAPVLDVERVRYGDRSGLREAVTLDDRHSGHRLPFFGHRALHRHAAGGGHLQGMRGDFGKARRIEQGVVQGIDADDAGEMDLLQFRDETRHVARIGDQDVVGADFHEHQVRGQGIDVVQRQGQDDGFNPLVEVARDPGRTLLQVGHHVAVREHRALRHPGGAPRVLQEGDVVVGQMHLLQLMPLACLQRLLQRDRAGDVPGRHHLLHVLDDQIGQQRLGGGEHVADLSRDHRRHLRPGEYTLQRIRKILQHQDRCGAGVVQLVLEFARGVQRVGIDHGEAGAQRAEQRHRILQQIGQHDRYAVSLAETEFVLQIGGEVAA
jgi:hypothetical protein